LLDKLWKRGQEFLGVKYPILCGAMTWVSDSNLVAAVSNEGAFGCLAAGNMPKDLLEEEINKTKKQTDKPFGVNIITISPNYKEHLEVVKEKGAPFVIFAGGLPRSSDIKSVKENGSKVLCFAPNESIANRLIKNGVDAIILEGNEAGGHIGPVSLIILIQEVLFKIKDSVPVFVAGGIATGKMMAYLLLMGASGIQMGTRFVLTEECRVHPEFKKIFIHAKAKDAVVSPQIGPELQVIPVRAIKNKGMEDFANLQMELIQKRRNNELSQSEAQYEVENFWMGALRRATQEGDVERGSLMAGQSVGLIDKIQPIKEIIEEMVEEAEQELQRVKEKFS
jgi:enoyl-[acyl-carrier protein] reductase II